MSCPVQEENERLKKKIEELEKKLEEAIDEIRAILSNKT